MVMNINRCSSQDTGSKKRVAIMGGNNAITERKRNVATRNESGRQGFTLVELLVVVAVLAIISGMVVSLMSGATDKAATTVSMATQKQLVNQINSYLALHNQTWPDNFDSLIRADYVAQGGTYAPVGATTNIYIASDLTRFISQAYTNSAATVMPQNVNRGVHLDAYTGTKRVLTVTQLSASDVSDLNALGITKVYDGNHADMFHGVRSYTLRTISTNQPVVVVDPQSVYGQALYKDLGIDLSDNSAYPKDANGELTDTGRGAAFAKQTFWVLALGPNSTMIGDQNAGIQEAPACAAVSYGFYNGYLVVIKKHMNPYSQTSALASVLDSLGRGASASREAVNSVR